MTEIKLDLQQLLGFKIIATNGAAMALCPPKIGVKTCQVVDTAAAPNENSGTLRATVGTKT